MVAPRGFVLPSALWRTIPSARSLPCNTDATFWQTSFCVSYHPCLRLLARYPSPILGRTFLNWSRLCKCRFARASRKRGSLRELRSASSAQASDTTHVSWSRELGGTRFCRNAMAGGRDSQFREWGISGGPAPWESGGARRGPAPLGVVLFAQPVFLELAVDGRHVHSGEPGGLLHASLGAAKETP